MNRWASTPWPTRMSLTCRVSSTVENRPCRDRASTTSCWAPRSRSAMMNPVPPAVRTLRLSLRGEPGVDDPHGAVEPPPGQIRLDLAEHGGVGGVAGPHPQLDRQPAGGHGHADHDLGQVRTRVLGMAALAQPVVGAVELAVFERRPRSRSRWCRRRSGPHPAAAGRPRRRTPSPATPRDVRAASPSSGSRRCGRPAPAPARRPVHGSTGSPPASTTAPTPGRPPTRTGSVPAAPRRACGPADASATSPDGGSCRRSPAGPRAGRAPMPRPGRGRRPARRSNATGSPASMPPPGTATSRCRAIEAIRRCSACGSSSSSRPNECKIFGLDTPVSGSR